MSKKAFFKKLLVAGLCAVTATATVGMTACKKDKEEENKKESEQVQEYTVTWNLDGGEWATGATQGAAKVADGGKITKPSDPSKSGYTFGGWVKEDGTAFDFDAAISANTTIKAKWTEVSSVTPPPADTTPTTTPKIIEPTLKEEDDDDPVPGPDGKIDISYTLNPEEMEAKTYSEGWTDGVFSIISNTAIRSRSKKGPLYEGTNVVDNDYKSANSVQLVGNGEMTVEITSAGTLVLYALNGSSGTTDKQTLKLTKPGGATEDVKYTATNLQRVTIELSESGKYSLKAASGTTDIYYASFSTKADVTDVEKIEVTDGGTVDFYLGQQFSIEGLTVNAIYEETGTRKAIPAGRLKVEYTDFDSSESGEYTIKVSYDKGGKTFKAEYTVTVYELTNISLSTYTTNGNKQTTLKQVYLPNDTFSTAGLTVTATTKCGEKTAVFGMSANQYTVSQPDMTTVGEKTVTVTAKDNTEVKATYSIYVVNKAQAVSNKVTVSVNADEAVSSTNFKTVTQALAYLANYENSVTKVINLADGEYYEKISIDIPNVWIIGSGTATPDAQTDNGAVLWFDALNGKVDAGGSSYGTNGSASVTVTSNATGFIAKNVTFKNKYNTKALYDESKSIGSGTQAVALLVESNSASFYNCKITSYHDTLYSNKGNHYYKDCWIEGHTDFIFGQNAVSYFDNCTIYSIGAGETEKNGGYVVAYQNTSTSYGPIFNGCAFTSDGNVKDGSIALGRAWGAEFKMVVINSTISVKYSITAHTNGTKEGQRYCSMDGGGKTNDPKPANMLEYNNSGDGAISASIANTCTYMTEAQAEAYALDKLATLLGFTPVNPQN